MKSWQLDDGISLMKKRILYVIGSLNVGGAERHVAMVSSALRERGWSPEVLCLAEEGVLAAQLREKGVPVHVLSLKGRSVRSFAFRPVRLAATLLACFLFLSRHRPDIVHFFLPTAYIVGGLCAWAAGISLRIMSRRSLNHYQRKYPMLGWLERWLHARMTLVVGNSRAVVNDLVSEGVPRSKLRLIYNGIGINPFDVVHDRRATREALGVPADAFMITIVANLIPYKGHQDMLAALAGVHGRLPSNWRLVCVGRDDGIGLSLDSLATMLGIAEHVVWAGPISDVPQILLASDIGVLSSHEEGFSNAVLEGMAAGLPMVVTDVGGNAEAVTDGETGRVAPPRNPVALGSALLALALDERRREIGRAARKRVEQSFSLEACVDAYESLYREAAGAVPERYG